MYNNKIFHRSHFGPSTSSSNNQRFIITMASAWNEFADYHLAIERSTRDQIRIASSSASEASSVFDSSSVSDDQSGWVEVATRKKQSQPSALMLTRPTGTKDTSFERVAILLRQAAKTGKLHRISPRVMSHSLI